MSESAIYAVFEPSEASLLASHSHTSLLVDNPILASALANIFPYILFVDDFLEAVTWTNENPYRNVLWVAAYAFVVMYWAWLRLWAIPVVCVAVFLSVVWNTNSVLYDAKFNERPTVDEVLCALHNVTVRFELLLRPARNLRLSERNYATMAASAVLATPVHVFAMKSLLLPQHVLLFVGVFILTYHSPYAFASRRLLWRSAYVRRCVFLLSGIDGHRSRHDAPLTRAHDTISRTYTPSSADREPPRETIPALNKAQMVNDFSITQKTILSATQLRQTVRFDILENERRWLGVGWSKLLLPNERSCFCYATLMMPAPDPACGHFSFPVYPDDLYTYQWQWMDEEWILDLEFDHTSDAEGWVYYGNAWELPRSYDGFSRYTRARKWTRRAVLLIDNREEVHDA